VGVNKYFWQGFLSVLWGKDRGLRNLSLVVAWTSGLAVYFVFLKEPSMPMLWLFAVYMVAFHCLHSVICFLGDEYLRRKNDL